MTTRALQGAGLEKRFADAVALAGVDLALRRGESVAVMGPSGSGKSTLLHCLAGITRPDGGAVWLDGRRIDNLGERSRSRLRRGQFGFVFQSGLLLPELPAAENVALPLMLEGQPRRRAVRRALGWLATLGLDGLEHRRPGELSGGQAQRVAIARAVVAEPAVVFADEPTAALDQATGVATVELLVQVTRDADAALLVVTHDPGIGALCDRIVHLRDGRIVPPPPPAPSSRPLDGHRPANDDGSPSATHQPGAERRAAPPPPGRQESVSGGRPLPPTPARPSPPHQAAPTPPAPATGATHQGIVSDPRRSVAGDPGPSPTHRAAPTSPTGARAHHGNEPDGRRQPPGDVGPSDVCEAGAELTMDATAHMGIVQGRRGADVGRGFASRAGGVG